MATIKYKDPATGEIRKIPFVAGNSTPESFYGVLPLGKGGTGSSTASGARTNLMVAQKPKLLWSGSFSSGSITVPGYSDYELFAFESAAAEGLFLIGGYWAGIGGFPIYGSNYITIMGYRFGVDGDRLSIDSYNKGITSWDPTSGATATSAATKIYGLVRKADIQGAT